MEPTDPHTTVSLQLSSVKSRNSAAFRAVRYGTFIWTPVSFFKVHMAISARVRRNVRDRWRMRALSQSAPAASARNASRILSIIDHC